ncbi:hypothetical protein, conserved [Trypanosoma brucei brucei TREU927]|uniref:Nuclear condensin complex subunit 3 C-terminal domain-containing protein n=1 Tax=Trypanosoma brucei brucei (strain 927/4 GUTat10.1) TaxID=185431 RepID=Q57ZK1_TRYB2|nr:hypothetical protein, conserved [Trypanosoma brucei brucei TREU927]AAX79481.1 hypothetical protein, conserved [Trypanosoma brucei]AAZ10345.1 hypothetical protein, conserved [Trypanosoma brucei brucei TREU927]
MPPKKKRVSKEFDVASVGNIFQRIHKSAAHIPQCRKELLAYFADNQIAVGESVCYVVLLVLKEAPRIPPDALKRQYNFLTDFCKECRERYGSDQIALTILKTVMGLHNANDKMVRLGVVSLFDALLRTVDSKNDTVARQNLYEDLAEVVKLRLHDKFPAVRERAVSCASYFQIGKKTCDMTQQLLALLCTDTSADVRRQILLNVRDRTEFTNGYFSSMIRCLRDAVARVRAAAWDALSRSRWEIVTACAHMRGVNLPSLIKEGLADGNKTVANACRAALTDSWLHRDNGDDCEATLQLLMAENCSCIDLESVDAFCTEMLMYCKRHNKAKKYVVDFGCVSAASLLLWKTSARLSADAEGEDEMAVLLPLAQFSTLLKDTINLFAHPDAEPETVKYKNADEADAMLRCLLSVFEIYQENGFLAHSDNTTRSSLLRNISFLLKIVPDDDPTLFVDIAVRTLKALTERTPEEATKTVTSALSSLFRCLRLPRKYSLGYDDVEAFGQKSRERHQHLMSLLMKNRLGGVEKEEYETLREEMDMDEKFLLRMQHIVFAFLSHSQRGDTIPSFCSHIIQLGRRLDNGPVKIVSTKSLGLQCLVNPDTVHTFMPLIMSDATDVTTEKGDCVSLAALGVVFDLVMEYGLRFFDCPTETRASGTYSNRSRSVAGEEVSYREDDDATAHSPASAGGESALEARLRHEKALSREDEHKVGGGNLLNSLRAFVWTNNAVRSTMAVVGFSKLLSCSRVHPRYVPEIIADLLTHLVAHRKGEKTNNSSAYMVDYLSKFFQSYASSHDQRQSMFAQGGVLAFVAMLRQHVPTASWLIEFVTKLSDALILVQIRNIDPTAARQAARLDDEIAPDDEEKSAMGKISSGRRTSARYSSQNSQLTQMLSKYSLHEFIASELLIEIAQNDSEHARDVCMTTLEKCMYFYTKALPSWLLFCCTRAIEVVGTDTPVRPRLESWRDEAVARFAVPISAEAIESLTTRWNETVEKRDQAVVKLLNCGITSGITSCLGEMARPYESSTPFSGDSVPCTATGVKKRAREAETVFEINSTTNRRGRTDR